MRPHYGTLTLAAADADGIATTQAGVASTALTLDGALVSGGVATLDAPRHVSITSVGNDSGITFTVTGTDRNGVALTETITGGNATVASGTENFATVTEVTPSGNTAGNVTVGTADAAETAWWPLPRHTSPINIGVFHDETAGALTVALQYTFTDVQTAGFQESDAKAFVDATYTGKTDDFAQNFTIPARAIRFSVTGNGAMSYGYVPAGCV